jgi:uncharacterized protein YacL
MVLWSIRILFAALVASMMVLGFREGGPFAFKEIDPNTFTTYKTIVFVFCFGVLIAGLMIDLLVKRKNLSALAGIFFGLVVGILIGLALTQVIESIYETYNITAASNPSLFKAKEGIKWLVNVFCCYLAIIFILQTKDDFRFIFPYVEFSKQTKGTRPMLLDTSVIIDGRIADIAGTRIMDSPMIVPRFILNELQAVADSADRLRRTRGRRGLDVLNKMQTNPQINMEIQEIKLAAHDRHEPVDLKLVAAAQQLSGKIITNDYNLNKLASLRGVEVININDLAAALKPVIIPGENIRIKVVKPGDQPGQGVGYLDDGTMVVIEQGRDLLGQEVDLVVTSILQTSAGRMIFGKLEGGATPENYPSKNSNDNNRSPRPPRRYP